MDRAYELLVRWGAQLPERSLTLGGHPCRHCSHEGEASLWDLDPRTLVRTCPADALVFETLGVWPKDVVHLVERIEDFEERIASGDLARLVSMGWNLPDPWARALVANLEGAVAGCMRALPAERERILTELLGGLPDGDLDAVVFHPEGWLGPMLGAQYQQLAAGVFLVPREVVTLSDARFFDFARWCADAEGVTGAVVETALALASVRRGQIEPTFQECITQALALER